MFLCRHFFKQRRMYGTSFFFLDVIHVHVKQIYEKNVITNDIFTRPITG